MVHADCDEEYAKQLTAEHKVAEGTGVKRRLVWKPKTSHADNHYLDCRVYAACGADIRGIRRFEASQEAERETVKPPATKEKKHSWINGY